MSDLNEARAEDLLEEVVQNGRAACALAMDDNLIRASLAVQYLRRLADLSEAVHAEDVASMTTILREMSGLVVAIRSTAVQTYFGAAVET